MSNDPIPELMITDLETHKALVNPLRIRLLELLVDEAQTVKQLAAAVDVEPVKLYYHVNLLEKNGLIRVVDTQVVSGIIEKWYRVTAFNYRIDRTILSLQEDEQQAYLDEIFASIFEGTIELIRHSTAVATINLQKNPPHPHSLHLTRSRGYLSETQARAFYEKLHALILEFEGSIDAPGESDGKYVLTMALFPEKRPSSPPEEP
ncbi:MAG: helix-turn-helix transcriptional regulator [Anaerolineaceae bacterium]|nr:helix-turn-helix transcriptional regulator [Anaerolineaceae bacterium]